MGSTVSLGFEIFQKRVIFYQMNVSVNSTTDELKTFLWVNTLVRKLKYGNGESIP